MNWKYDGHRSKGLAHPSTQWPPRIKGTSDRQAGNRLLILKEYLGRKFWGKPRLSVSQTNTTLSFCMCLQIKHFEQQWNFELILTHYVSFMGFPGDSECKESTCNAGDLDLMPGLGRSPGEGNSYPLQYSCLGNAVDRGAWQATAHGVTKSRTRLSDFHFHVSFIDLLWQLFYFSFFFFFW